MISAIFDTNIFIQAILSETWPGSARVSMNYLLVALSFLFIQRYFPRSTIFCCGLVSERNTAKWAIFGRQI